MSTLLCVPCWDTTHTNKQRRHAYKSKELMEQKVPNNTTSELADRTTSLLHTVLSSGFTMLIPLYCISSKLVTLAERALPCVFQTTWLLASTSTRCRLWEPAGPRSAFTIRMLLQSLQRVVSTSLSDSRFLAGWISIWQTRHAICRMDRLCVLIQSLSQDGSYFLQGSNLGLSDDCNLKCCTLA